MYRVLFVLNWYLLNKRPNTYLQWFTEGITWCTAWCTLSKDRLFEQQSHSGQVQKCDAKTDAVVSNKLRSQNDDISCISVLN